VYVIPAIDILDGKVVRLRQGRYDEVTVYGDDPRAMLRSWSEQGAEIVHVVDLGGARDGRADPELVRLLAGSAVPFQLGGGIRTVEAAVGAISAGAQRVVLGTAAVWAPALAARIVGQVGAEHVVAAVDVRDGKATGAGWRDEGRELSTVLQDLTDVGVGRVLATGIATDGTLDGPDTGLLRDVLRLAPELTVIASGGVGSLGDLAALAELPVEAVIVGRALYDGRFTLAEAQRAARGAS
jgi:phosphoribosylformimino-5-aminoimidazole carboxamide ribotide isomerase